MPTVRGCCNRNDTVGRYYFAKHKGKSHLVLVFYETNIVYVLVSALRLREQLCSVRQMQ